MSTLSEWLKKKLEDKNMSIARLAFETGLSRTIIYYYLEDVNRPGKENLQKICDVLGADINEAIGLYTIKKIGRPVGSVKRWGREQILKKFEEANAPESIYYPDRHIV